MTEGGTDPGAWAEEEARGWNGFGHTAHVIKGLLARIDDLRGGATAARREGLAKAAGACRARAEALAREGDAAGAAAARRCAEAVEGLA